MAGLTYPFPAVGEVHNYEYLFRADADRGDAEGKKTRPVLVIAADPDTERVVVMPITTKGEPDGGLKISIPVDVGLAMGLPRPDESLLVTDEANMFTWVGFDLRPVPKTNSSRFGRATPGFVTGARNRFVAANPKITSR